MSTKGIILGASLGSSLALFSYAIVVRGEDDGLARSRHISLAGTSIEYEYGYPTVVVRRQVVGSFCFVGVTMRFPIDSIGKLDIYLMNSE